jgi:sec-independent protein translocase protein TatC
VSAQTLISGRKYAIVLILGFAAVFTPPDVISQLLLTGPVYFLYEISIFCVKLIEKKQNVEDAAAADR